MKINELVSFNIEKEGRLYQFILPKMSPVGETYDVLFQALKKVIEIGQKNVESVERDSKEDENSKES